MFAMRGDVLELRNIADELDLPLIAEYETLTKELRGKNEFAGATINKHLIEIRRQLETKYTSQYLRERVLKNIWHYPLWLFRTELSQYNFDTKTFKLYIKRTTGRLVYTQDSAKSEYEIFNLNNDLQNSDLYDGATFGSDKDGFLVASRRIDVKLPNSRQLIETENVSKGSILYHSTIEISVPIIDQNAAQIIVNERDKRKLRYYLYFKFRDVETCVPAQLIGLRISREININGKLMLEELFTITEADGDSGYISKNARTQETENNSVDSHTLMMSGELTQESKGSNDYRTNVTLKPAWTDKTGSPNTNTGTAAAQRESESTRDKTERQAAPQEKHRSQNVSIQAERQNEELPSLTNIIKDVKTNTTETTSHNGQTATLNAGVQNDAKVHTVKPDVPQSAAQQIGNVAEKTLPKSGIILRFISAGSFVMGSPRSEKERIDNETQHLVKISKPFYMGKYEVTQGQWISVMGNNPSCFVKSGENAPVEQVTWTDCQEFLRKLEKLEELPEGSMRLPTEAEWEYACRAGTQTVFCYGNDLDSSMANFDGDFPYGKGAKGLNRERTVPVGSFKPNAWGLYDMHGNVSEWCNDWFDDKYYGYGNSPGSDPHGPKTGSVRVLRGGNWYNCAEKCRSASRYYEDPDERDEQDNTHNVIGFRIVLNADTDSEVVEPPINDASQEPETGQKAKGDGFPSWASTKKAVRSIVAQATTDNSQPTVGKTIVQDQPMAMSESKPVGNTSDMEMKLVTGGTFIMGSSDAPSEMPAHKVTVSSFYMDESEVSQDAYQRVMGSPPRSFFKGPRLPVDSVKWPDAVAFCNARSVKEGLPPVYDYQGNVINWDGGGYRLPTEAEWEYACRAGTTTKYSSGDGITAQQANYDPNLGKKHPSFRARSMPVKSLPPNQFGLYDMHGNLWEWCQDYYGPYTANDATNPVGPAQGTAHVIRGGSWWNAADSSRSAKRYDLGAQPMFPQCMGFRCVRSAK